jgi:hypothetical protein
MRIFLLKTGWISFRTSIKTAATDLNAKVCDTLMTLGTAAKKA